MSTQEQDIAPLVAHDRPTRVSFASGHKVEFPAGTDPKEVLERSRAIENLLLGDKNGSQTSAQVVDQMRQIKEGTGRVIASILGLDYDHLKALDAQGVKLAMIPVEPSGISKKMIDEGIGTKVTADMVKPRRGMFHSYLLDKDGNILDLGDLTHDVAFAKTGEATPIKFTDADYKNIGYENEADALAHGEGLEMGEAEGTHNVDLPAALEKNKMIRLQVQPSSIATEMYHKPTPHQVDALEQLFEHSPNSKASYDMFLGDSNIFKNGVSKDDFLKSLNDFYYAGGKTNTQFLRESLDKGLEKTLPGPMFQPEGEVYP